jgi:hypothetical protein
VNSPQEEPAIAAPVSREACNESPGGMVNGPAGPRVVGHVMALPSRMAARRGFPRSKMVAEVVTSAQITLIGAWHVPDRRR